MVGALKPVSEGNKTNGNTLPHLAIGHEKVPKGNMTNVGISPQGNRHVLEVETNVSNFIVGQHTSASGKGKC